MQFDAEDKLLNDILNGRDKYKIPRYQRPYSWSIDQVSDLWNDLREEESVFLGSFVFNYESYKKDGFVEVIDGQQRLITLTILIAVLRDVYKDLGDEDKARLTQDTIAHKDLITGKETYKLQCGESLNKFFCDNIQKSPSRIITTTPKEKEKIAVRDNYQYLKDKITTELKLYQDKSKQIEYLDGLRSKIFNYKIILIQTGNDDDAYSIFETVNARGADLTVADLLKNYLFSKLPNMEDGIDTAKDTWSTIENNIESAEGRLTVSKFIRYFWISKYSFVQEKKLYREVKRTINDPGVFLSEMSRASDCYYKIASAKVDVDDWLEVFENKSIAQRIMESLNGLRVMGITQCYSLLFCLLMNSDKIGFNFSEVFKDIEKYHFGYSAICKLSGNVVERIYVNAAHNIQEAIKISNPEKRIIAIQQHLSRFREELKDKYPSKAVFVEKFMDIEYKNYGLVIYILSNIERFKVQRAEEANFTKTNIEHILPQDPQEWSLTKKDVKGYVNMLGNLTLISKKINGPMGNRRLEEKIKIFKETNLSINKELMDKFKALKYKWGEEEIKNRQKELAECAYDEVWKFK